MTPPPWLECEELKPRLASAPPDDPDGHGETGGRSRVEVRSCGGEPVLCRGPNNLSVNGSASTEQGNETSDFWNQSCLRLSGAPIWRQPHRRPPAPAPSHQRSRRPRGAGKCCFEQQAPRVLAAVLVIGIPWTLEALNTVSTDDAYVNGHVTSVAAPGPRPGRARRTPTTTTGCIGVTFSSSWTRSRTRPQSPSKGRPSIRQRQICWRRPPRCAASKRRRGAGAGNCSTPWRTSPIRKPNCALVSPASTKQGGAGAGRARPRAGGSLVATDQYSLVGVRSPASDPGDSARRAGSGPGRCESDSCLPGF